MKKSDLENIFKVPFEVKETHLDFLGHMNNATYLQILEQSRWDLISKNGYGIEKIKEMGISPIVLDIHIRYKKELLLREKVTITVEFEKSKSKIQKIEQKIIKENGQVACEATFTIGLFDLKTRHLVEPSDDWLKAIQC